MHTSNQDEYSVKPQHQTTSNHVDVGHLSKTTDSVDNINVAPTENKGFDAMVDEATRTQAQEKAQAEAQKPQQLAFTQEQAANMSIQVLDGAMGLLTSFTKTQIVLPNQLKMGFALLTAPLMQKYGGHITKLLEEPDAEDLEGYLPETLAAGAVALVGVPAYMQIKQAKLERAKQAVRPDLSKEAANDGD